MTQPTGSNPAQKIPVSIQDEMRTSYLDYAMSVIIGRAIPDVRDGLKPVHRRILYSAYEQNLMENVVDYERWGIPTGVPIRATVGVKNGWYPEKATGWQVNTAGFVRLGKTYYLACVMTGSNPREAYGITVVDRVAQAFWNFESSRANK